MCNKMMDNYMSVRVAKCRGFSILEIVIALAIMGILLFSGGKLVQTTRDFDDVAENKRYMNQVHDMLLTFVQVNGFLPCPDTDGDGAENRIGTDFRCADHFGTIPFLDLGVSAKDAWNQPLRYAVNRRTATSADISNSDLTASYFNDRVGGGIPFFRFSTPPIATTVAGGEVPTNGGNYRICSETTVDCVAGDNLIEAAAIVVVVSFGKNGAQTWANGVTGLSAAEAENIDENDLRFWLAQGSNDPANSFDDQLFWLTGYDVKYAVIKSGGVLLP